MKRFYKPLIFIALMSIIVLPARSQEESDYQYRPFQLTLFPPIGTNGPDYRNCVNKISLNLLWGESAGLQGLELGWIANIEHDFAKGVQMAGVANVVDGDVTGLQFTHVVNIAKGTVVGGQFSGFMNVAKDLTGISSAGFMAISDDVLGLQGSGFMNIANDVAGVQASGFMNIADEIRGAQLSDFMNIADEVRGAQVSGFMNIAENVKGTQVGFINIADNYESGVPVGFINIVKNGYHDFEISGSEIWDLNVGYRLGVDRLYTQFMIGTRWDKHDDFWGFGFGVGTRFHITHYLKGSVDLLSYQLIDHGHMHAEHPNLLEQARFTLEGKILGHLKWFVGPTFNVLVAPYEYPEPAFLNHISPWTVYENASGVSYVKMWPGISGGIRF